MLEIWRIEGSRPPQSIFFIFMQFSAKIMLDNRLALLGLAPPLRIPGIATVHSFFVLAYIKENKHKHSLSFAMHFQDLVLELIVQIKNNLW